MTGRRSAVAPRRASAILLAALVVSVAALAASRDGGATGGATAADGLPTYIAGFERWRKLNARPIPVRASDPHRSVKDVYANKRRGARAFPVGTIIVKAGRPPGKRWLSLVAIMRRTATTTANGGWAWVEYTRSGPRERFQRVGFPESGCAACHAQAKARDWVFTTR